jgi:hypothetical protein
MKTVYVAHPLRGSEVKNRRRVSDILRELDRDYPEHLFLSPIHSFGWLGGDHERALTLCLRLLAQADELWLFGDWQNSEGCVTERHEAMRLGIPVCAPTRIPLEVKRRG